MKELNAFELNENMISTIGRDWMLVTAGTEESFNTMTVSWGGVGILWNKPVVYTFIRPQRYTYEFLENSEYYTMSAYPNEYRNALKLCGTRSGRDINKPLETGLTPVFDEKAPYFEQARLVLVCRKLYVQDLCESGATDKSILANYHGDDYHRMYVSEIVKVLVNE
ncbi:MAG: flavin reductase [Clostridia bacterium]|nr:flavin reductase [Clostridia bacterium]MBQ2153261.1 flavin reductase [Clostridia bacterium]MBQ5439337.1 flavin reductase [Clostridia bacterium]